jgi:hypothetical protein
VGFSNILLKKVTLVKLNGRGVQSNYSTFEIHSLTRPPCTLGNSMTRPTLETQNCVEVDQMHGIGRHDPMVSSFVGVSAVDPSSPESVSDPRDRPCVLSTWYFLAGLSDSLP